MTSRETASYRRQLLSLKERLGGELSALEQEALRPVGGEASGDLSNLPIDPADLGSDNYEEEISLGLLENEDQVVQEVDDALKRIEQGTYGRCERCHKEIPRKRLQALPYARFCIQCARKDEREAGVGV